MSRPRIDEQDKHLVQVNIRLTTDESRRLNDYATASGLSPAKWIRYKIVAGKNPPVKMSPLDTSIYQELKRVGVNLNQVAHKLNQGEQPGDLARVQEELVHLLNRILKALLHDRKHD